ncbi:MAG: hypothetical protein HYS57_02100, partial [Parcubacteria group bacterium]|nr:hypothetical protein [Parcubacteria group bacterium]
MPKFESVPKPKGHALNPSETGADVKVVPKPEAKRTSEKTETLQEEGGQEQEAGQFPLSFEERLHKLERDIAARQQE